MEQVHLLGGRPWGPWPVFISRDAGENDRHVHLAEMGGACSDLDFSDQLLGVVRARSQEPPAFLK